MPIHRLATKGTSKLIEKVLVAATTVAVPILISKIDEIVKYYGSKSTTPKRKKTPPKKARSKKASAKKRVRKVSSKKPKSA